MKKKLFSFVLVLILLLSLAPFSALAAKKEEAAEEAEPAPIPISTAEEFAAFAKNCTRESYSKGRRFVLTADLDLSAVSLDPVPYFAGRFDGQGHVLSGLSLCPTGSRQGLFRQLGEEGEIRQLAVKGRVEPGGSRDAVGGIVGYNEGSVANCSFSGQVRGLSNTGGIVGQNAETGRVVSCRFDGGVIAEHQVGGIVGQNDGMLKSCVNFGEVNTEAIVPESEPHFDLASFSQDDFVNLSNIGGIAGSNGGVVLNCRSSGAVGYLYTGYNVGGVVGKSNGYVTGCSNLGPVEGRRDVGGIVGQLLPYAAWDFSNGRLDALSQQISGMQYLVNQATQDANNQSAALRGELGTMSSYIHQAASSLADLLQQVTDNDYSIIASIEVDPETGNVSFPNLYLNTVDTSGLTNALNNMYAESTVLASYVGDSVSTVAGNLNNIAAQMTRIFDTLFGMVSDVSNGSLISTRDLSFEEVYDHNEGAVADSKNLAPVHGETCVGGVVGTVAFEVEFDMEDTLGSSNFLATNAEQFLFAAIRGCESRGKIESRSDNAGGIVGRMDVGAVVDSVNRASISSQNGDYVGGIAGTTAGTVSACWSQSQLAGGSYVGGVAGLGQDLLNCRAWTHIDRAEEYQGAVAGWSEGTIQGNLYAPGGVEGVDGVSRIGQAELVSSRSLLALEGAPEAFGTVTLQFVADGELVESLSLPFGGAVKELPAVSNQGADYWVWEDFDRAHVYCSRDILGEYRAPASTISSGEAVPRFLVEGSFYTGQSLSVENYDSGLSRTDLLGGYRLTVNDYTETLTVRMRCETPQRVFSLGADGSLTEIPGARDGQYLVFSLPNGGAFVCLSEKAGPWRVILPVGAAVLAAAGVVLLIRRKKKKQPGNTGGAAE